MVTCQMEWLGILFLSVLTKTFLEKFQIYKSGVKKEKFHISMTSQNKKSMCLVLISTKQLEIGASAWKRQMEKLENKVNSWRMRETR